MAIANAQIQLTDTTILTVPASKSYAITTLIVCNTSNYDISGNNDTTFDMHIVPSGQAKGATNQICNNIRVQGADTFTFDTEKIVEYVLKGKIFLKIWRRFEPTILWTHFA